MDSSTSIEQLKILVKAFCEAREWDQFHNPKDLGIGISTEAAELLDLFRFKSNTQIEEALKSEQYRLKVQHELADVLFFVLRFSQMNGIDLSEALNKKLELNNQKYPVESSKGSNKKYNE